MSTLATNAITDASGGTTATINGYTPTMSNMAGRNRIINGDMRIDQRNAGAAVTVNTGNAFYSVDRYFGAGTNSAGVFTIQQSSTAPAGFNSSALITVTTSATPSGTDNYRFNQAVEGLNVADLNWGSANAQAVTLSFWVRSSLTGTFGGALQNSDKSRTYPFSYTISSADTWEQKTITVSGDTTGAWLTTNGIGVLVVWCLGAADRLGTAGSWSSTRYDGATGQTNLISTNGATLYITGVQLEAGSVATPFEHRQYGQELALCQRYYAKYTGDSTGQTGLAIGYQTSTTVSLFCLNYPVTMRSEPTCTLSNIQVSDGITYDADVTFSYIASGYTSSQIQVTNSAVGAQFRPFRVLTKNNNTGYVALSAEL